MLPHVELRDGDQRGRDVALLVVQLHDDQLLAQGVPGGDRPAGALDAERRGLELGPVGVERTEVVVDGGLEVSGGLVAALGGQVLPEDRVVDVTTEVEREVLLQQVDRVVGLTCASLVELLQGRVQAVDVVLVVLGVVQLHDLARDVRVQSAIVVGKFRKGVIGHVSSCGQGHTRAPG